MRIQPLSYALLCALATLTACGGGGGTRKADPVPIETAPQPIQSPTVFETEEYLKMGGHALIKASAAYAVGADGAGKTVVVADSGADATHSELAGRLNLGAGWDYISGKAVDGSDSYGHGTHVAGIIAGNKNNTGAHGVAYKSTVVPFRLMDNDGKVFVSDALLADMAKRAANANAIAMNSSWGAPTGVRSVGGISSMFGQFKTAAVTAGKSGTVFVWSNGNNSLAHPGLFAALPDQIKELQPYWLAVAAVDPVSGKIAGFSNRCGYAAAWCLSAPGVGIYSSLPGEANGSMSGTSMAAPYVTGSIALLGSYFKTLSGPQIAQRLLKTANKTGDYADQSVYGQGLLDLEAALRPVDGAFVPTSTTTEGEVTDMRSAVITVPPGYAHTVRKALGDKNVLVVDGYQRATFLVKASSLVRERSRGNASEGQGNGLSAYPAYKTSAPGMSFSLFSNRAAGSMQGMATQFAGHGGTLRMGYGAHAASGDMSFLSDDISPQFAQFVRGGDPVAMLTQNFVGGTYVAAKDMKFTGQYASMVAGTKYDLGVEKAFGKTKLGLMSSYQSGLPESVAFGSSRAGSGAAYQLYASHSLREGVNVVGAVGVGQSKIDESMGQWRIDGDTRRSFASIGAVFTNPKNGSRLGLSYRVDHRTGQGMTLRLPVDSTNSGDVVYQSVHLQDEKSKNPGAIGLFYEAELESTKVVFSLAAERQNSGVWLGLKRAF